MDDDSAFFNIEVDSSSSEPEAERVPRDFQSEKDFQAVKAHWSPKVETGEIWKTLKLPVDNPSKPEAETILHAIEELCFLKRYGEAKAVAEEALKGELGKVYRGVLEGYLASCVVKLKGDAP